MWGRARIGWLALTCLLLVLLVGALNSGRIGGVKSLGGPGGTGLAQTGPFLSSSGNTTTGVLTANASSTQQAGVPGAQLLGIPQVQPPLFMWWYALVPVVLVIAAASVALLRRPGGPKVFDFKAALDEMEEQRSRIVRGWAGGRRNEALLRYYAVMLGVCGRMGIKESPADTPSEYLSKVAARMKIEPSQAQRFALVFSRARYGLELSPEETGAASEFMGGFLDSLRSGARVG